MTPTKIIFRFDDISASSGVDIEKAIFDAFLAQRIPLTVGVIPFECAGDVHVATPQEEVPLTDSKFSLLRHLQDEGFEMAQHGFSHQVRAGYGFHTEFVGRPFDDQLSRIARGKHYLETQLKIESFIPPWNGYDGITIRALEALDFRTLSADPYGYVYPESLLQYMPANITLPDLSRTVESARACFTPSKLIVVLLHAYEFRESKSDRAILCLDDLRHILRALPIGGHLECTTLREGAAEGRYSARSFLAGRRRARLLRVLPPFLRQKFSPDGVSVYPRLREAPKSDNAGAARISASE